MLEILPKFQNHTITLAQPLPNPELVESLSSFSLIELDDLCRILSEYKFLHQGLLYKIKKSLSDSMFTILKSFLEKRHFQVRHENVTTKLLTIRAGADSYTHLDVYKRQDLYS